MLRKETVSPNTLGILKDLMQDESLADFFLVGGTALSLQIGHRLSIDLDLFSLKPIDENLLLEHLEKRYGFQSGFQAKNTLKGQIDNTEVDFITHEYPLIEKTQDIEGMRIASLKDIAAMKLNAITGNGTRLKDFIDVAYLSSYLSLKAMIDAYEAKYSIRNPFSAMKALAYHDDINFGEPIHFANGNFSWKIIEKRLDQMIKDPDKVFPEITK